MNSSNDISHALYTLAIPLDSTDPDADLSDLVPLNDTLNGAAIIGLGEATHGTREFFQLKDRIVRYLVTEAGLRLFALEANFSETLAINDYVTKGKGDPLTALKNIYFWTWDTEEVLALIEWLRDFNQDRKRANQVKFYGIDMLYTSGAVRALANYLEVVDPEFAIQYSDTLETLTDMGQYTDEENQNNCLVEADQFVSVLATRFTERKSVYVDKTTKAEYDLAVQHNRILQQALEAKRALQDDEIEASVRIRDRAMAENAQWIFEHEPHDVMVIWAHNAHVRRGSVEGDWGEARTMGDHLNDEYGDGYFALGFNFAGGEFQAKVEQDEGKYKLEACQIGELRDGSITEALANVDESLYFLNIEECIEDGVVGPLFTENREIFTAGAVYYGQDADDHYETVIVREVYDGLIFVEETNRAIPIERV